MFFRHEVWVFIQKGKCRRLVLTETGAVQQVDATGKPITREAQNEQPDHPKQESKQDSPKISLQEVSILIIGNLFEVVDSME